VFINFKVQTASTIETVVKSLPGVNTTEDDQLNRLQELQEQNELAGKNLKLAVESAGTISLPLVVNLFNIFCF